MSASISGEGLDPTELVARLEKVTGKSYSVNQRNAILYPGGPLWITAGPGSGKTEVLVALVLRLMLSDRIAPSSIFLTTFTERAAANLSHRIASYLEDLGYSDQLDVTELWTGTLHSLCNRIMREHRFPEYVDLELLDEDDRAFFLFEQRDILKRLKAHWTEFPELFGNRVSATYGPNKWALVSAASFAFDRIAEFRVNVEKMRKSRNARPRVLAELYVEYRRLLTSAFRCDLAILQEHFLTFLRSPHGEEFLGGNAERERRPVTHFLVDEYQDTNPIQEEIYFELARSAPHNLIVVGDDDQSLYRFRGGTVDSLVQFGDKVASRWHLHPTRADLNDNYRSHPKIVNFVNDYITAFPLMQKGGVRAPGKRRLVASSDVAGAYPAVSIIQESDIRIAAKSAVDLIKVLHDDKRIDDWSDVGILLHSTKESPRLAGPFADALRDQGIKLYNPRSRALHRDPLIQQLLGALVSVLDKNLRVLHGKYTNGNPVRGSATKAAEDWVQSYNELAEQAEGKELASYVRGGQAAITKFPKGKLLNTTVMDVLYRILSFEPFRSARNEVNEAPRLATITSLLDSFTAFSEGRGLLSTSTRTPGGGISTGFLNKFYYEFAGYIETSGLNEPEDPEDLVPRGYVQLMTVHQAKGLEFPVVIVGSLDSKPQAGREYWAESFLSQWSPRKVLGSKDERAAQDLVRRFYVAYSRAKNLVILCASAQNNNRWGFGG